jgi:hypothetical protein
VGDIILCPNLVQLIKKIYSENFWELRWYHVFMCICPVFHLCPLCHYNSVPQNILLSLPGISSLLPHCRHSIGGLNEIMPSN